MNKIIKHKKVIVTFAVILSILFGVFIFKKLNNNDLQSIITNSNKFEYITINGIIMEIIIFSSSFLLSFTGIGIVILMAYLFFEGMSIGFISAYFVSIYKIKGFVYSICYILTYKAILIFLIIIIILKYMKLVNMIIKLIKKENVNITKTIVNILITFLIIFANNIFLLFLGDKILNIFSFLIK